MRRQIEFINNVLKDKVIEGVKRDRNGHVVIDTENMEALFLELIDIRILEEIPVSVKKRLIEAIDDIKYIFDLNSEIKRKTAALEQCEKELESVKEEPKIEREDVKEEAFSSLSLEETKYTIEEIILGLHRKLQQGFTHIDIIFSDVIYITREESDEEYNRRKENITKKREEKIKQDKENLLKVIQQTKEELEKAKERVKTLKEKEYKIE